MRNWIMIGSMVVLIGCASKTVTAPSPMATEPAESAAVAEKQRDGGQPDGTPERHAVEGMPAEQITQISADTAGASTHAHARADLQDVYFDYDQYVLRPDARKTLDLVAERLTRDKRVALLIEGHADERGTSEYNLALGERRAGSVRNYLLAKGIDAARLRTVSYGKEKPQCFESDESCWQKNRRGHLVAVD